MKQVFEANAKLRRVICAVLVAIMVIGMIPLAAPKAAAIGSGDILYLKPNGATAADAWFAVWFFGGSGADQMVRMEKYDNNLYYCTIPEGGYTKCTFVRKNPSNQNLDWKGVWNKSSDQLLSSGNCFVANDGSMRGGWDTIDDVINTCNHPSHNQSGNCTSCGASVGHSFSAATCTAPKTCSVCGATSGSPAGHSWKDATCAAPKTCSVCGATEGTTGEHSWTNATCTTPKTCSICGATEGDALGHSIANGSCSRCGGKVVAYLVGQMNSWNQTSLPMIGTDSDTGSETIELTEAK